MGNFYAGFHHWLDVDPVHGTEDDYCAQICFAVDNSASWPGLAYVCEQADCNCHRCELLLVLLRANVPTWERGVTALDIANLRIILNQK